MPSTALPSPTRAESPSNPALSRPRRTALAVLTALAMAVSLVAAPSPARADAAKGNWNTFHTICNGCTVDEGNLIRFWQTIVMARFYGSYYAMTCSFVDGSFGPNTRDWTERMQRQLGVDDDGVVGPNTWTAVRNQLVLVSSGTTTNIYRYQDSDGVSGAYPVRISYYRSTGYWRFYDDCGPNEYVYLNHS